MLLDPSVIELGAAALIGASIGAFAATAAIRFSEGRSPWHGRSCCDGCGRQLSVYETIPLVGYVTSRGRCRTCHAKIDPLHPVSESTGLVLLPLCLWLRPGLDGVLIGALAMLLLTTAIVDLRTYRLLDVFTIPIAVLSLVIAWREHQIPGGAVAALLSAGVLLAVKVLLERRGGKAMLGYGDVKLVSALALMLGDQTPAMLAVAAGAGIAVGSIKARKFEKPVPFGPFLFVGFWAIVIVKHFLPLLAA